VANTDLGDLEPRLLRELGGVAFAPVFMDRIDLLVSAVETVNGEASKIFELTGTTLDREANGLERRALVLEAAKTYLRGKALGASEGAISHSNVAGRTDLTQIARFYGERYKEVCDELDALYDRLRDAAIAGEVVANELGETKEVVINRALIPLFTELDGTFLG